MALIASAFVLVANAALACSCMAIGTFLEYARQSPNVIHARVERLGPRFSHGEALHESMRVEVLSVVKGDLEADSIVLLGDPGFMCRDAIDARVFAVGKEFLIALHSDEDEQPFGGCGEAWVTINGDVVEGAAFIGHGREKYSLPLADVIAAFSQ